MGNCCSPGNDEIDADFTDSAPIPNTGQGPVLSHSQLPVPILSNNNLDSSVIGHTLDHISDREGGCNYCYIYPFISSIRPF